MMYTNAKSAMNKLLTISTTTSLIIHFSLHGCCVYCLVNMSNKIAFRSTNILALHSPGPLLDFLVPSAYRISSQRRHASAIPSAVPKSFKPESDPIHSATEAKSRRPLTQEQQHFLDQAVCTICQENASRHNCRPLSDMPPQLRVNQAGELAATLIYRHQTPPLLRTHPHLRPLMAHMYEQEAGHFSTFNRLLARHRIRPTAMYPVWVAASSLLGWGTGLMGREAAMACTEAVETEIGGHYDRQVRQLASWMEGMEERGEEVGEEVSVYSVPVSFDQLC